MKQFLRACIVSLMGVFLLAQAQPQKILEDYKPVIDLSMQVMAMLELETTTDLVLSKEQAVTLLPVLTEFQSKETMTNDEALAYQQQLSETLLTLEQHEWVIARSNELFTELFNTGKRPSIGMGLGARLMAGEPVNLVKEGPGKDSLIQLVEIVSAKAS